MSSINYTKYGVENKGFTGNQGNPRVESEECAKTSRFCAHEMNVHDELKNE